jgi:hypothetical protein
MTLKLLRYINKTDEIFSEDNDDESEESFSNEMEAESFSNGESGAENIPVRLHASPNLSEALLALADEIYFNIKTPEPLPEAMLSMTMSMKEEDENNNNENKENLNIKRESIKRKLEWDSEETLDLNGNYLQ